MYLRRLILLLLLPTVLLGSCVVTKPNGKGVQKPPPAPLSSTQPAEKNVDQSSTKDESSQDNAFVQLKNELTALRIADEKRVGGDWNSSTLILGLTGMWVAGAILAVYLHTRTVKQTTKAVQGNGSSEESK